MKQIFPVFFLFALLLCGCRSPRPGAGLEGLTCLQATPEFCLLALGPNQLKIHANREFALFNGTPVRLPKAPLYDTRSCLYSVTPEIRKNIIDPLLENMVIRKGVKVILLDPGHGGRDMGAKGSRYQEKSLNLALAKAAASELRKAGYTVIFTRTGDVFKELKVRAGLSAKVKAELFLSIHCNSSQKNPKAAGVECFAFVTPRPESTALACRLQRQLVYTLKATDRGVKFANFSVLRNNTVPAVLIEAGFISNAEEEKRLGDPRYQQLFGKSVAAAVRNFAPPLPQAIK